MTAEYRVPVTTASGLKTIAIFTDDSIEEMLVANARRYFREVIGTTGDISDVQVVFTYKNRKRVVVLQKLTCVANGVVRVHVYFNYFDFYQIIFPTMERALELYLAAPNAFSRLTAAPTGECRLNLSGGIAHLITPEELEAVAAFTGFSIINTIFKQFFEDLEKNRPFEEFAARFDKVQQDYDAIEADIDKYASTHPESARALAALRRPQCSL